MFQPIRYILKWIWCMVSMSQYQSLLDTKHHKGPPFLWDAFIWKKSMIKPVEFFPSLHLIEWLQSNSRFLGSLEHQTAALAPCDSSLRSWGRPMLPLIHLTGSQRRSISRHLLKLESLEKIRLWRGLFKQMQLCIRVCTSILTVV